MKEALKYIFFGIPVVLVVIIIIGSACCGYFEILGAAILGAMFFWCIYSSFWIYCKYGDYRNKKRI